MDHGGGTKGSETFSPTDPLSLLGVYGRNGGGGGLLRRLKLEWRCCELLRSPLNHCSNVKAVHSLKGHPVLRNALWGTTSVINLGKVIAWLTHV